MRKRQCDVDSTGYSDGCEMSSDENRVLSLLDNRYMSLRSLVVILRHLFWSLWVQNQLVDLYKWGSTPNANGRMNNKSMHLCNASRGSSDKKKVAGYGLEDMSQIPDREEFFSLPPGPHRLWCSASYPTGTEGKAARREADHLAPSTAEVAILVLPCTYWRRSLSWMKHRYNFTPIPYWECIRTSLNAHVGRSTLCVFAFIRTDHDSPPQITLVKCEDNDNVVPFLPEGSTRNNVNKKHVYTSNLKQTISNSIG
jgi:hypothetical protein